MKCREERVRDGWKERDGIRILGRERREGEGGKTDKRKEGRSEGTEGRKRKRQEYGRHVTGGSG